MVEGTTHAGTLGPSHLCPRRAGLPERHLQSRGLSGPICAMEPFAGVALTFHPDSWMLSASARGVLWKAGCFTLCGLPPPDMPQMSSLHSGLHEGLGREDEMAMAAFPSSSSFFFFYQSTHIGKWKDSCSARECQEPVPLCPEKWLKVWALNADRPLKC